MKKEAPGRSDEVIGILLLSLAVLLLTSLLSYTPWDPSFNVVTVPHRTLRPENLVGKAGAALSDGLMNLFGRCAYLLPVLIFIFSLSFFFHRRIRQKGVRFLGFLGILVSSSVLLDLILNPGKDGFSRAGGVMGHMIARLLYEGLNTVGTYIVSSTLLMVSLVVSTETSPITILSVTWTGVRMSGAAAAFLLHKLWVTAVIMKERVRRKRERAKAAARVSLPRDEEPPHIVKKAPEPRAQRKKVEQLSILEPRGKYTLPSIALLDSGEGKRISHDEEMLKTSSAILAKKLGDFGVEGRVTAVHPGPVITLYEVEPAAGVKVSQIVNLSDDLALALRAASVRIIAPLPGKGTVGIEIPNPQRETVRLRDILSSPAFEKGRGRLTLGLGRDISGDPVLADLEKMPHLLVAGTTGSGKSVALHAMIMSVILRSTPEEVKFLMVDPKMLELPVYEGLPHLAHPVVTDPKEAAEILSWTVKEMERRYQMMNAVGAKNLSHYNQKAEAVVPYVIVIIDELADLMLISPKKVEEGIARLSQKARAAGIHLIVATQRPSVDVITGTIKTNFSARIAMRVPSKTDSRTILDANGAESLLGEGDMLYMPPGTSEVRRVHGAFVSEGEIRRVTDFWKGQGSPAFDESIEEWKKKAQEGEEDGAEILDDDKYDEAVAVVKESGRASISFVQRRLRIGYNRAARMIERMEREGVVKKSLVKQEWEVSQ